jgi:hypothetical protein
VVNSGAPEVEEVPAPLVAPVVLIMITHVPQTIYKCLSTSLKQVIKKYISQYCVITLPVKIKYWYNDLSCLSVFINECSAWLKSLCIIENVNDVTSVHVL